MAGCALGRGDRASIPTSRSISRAAAPSRPRARGLDAAGPRPSPVLVATASERQADHAAPVRTGPVVIGYDASAASVHALMEAAALLRGRTALVVTVWKPGLGFELV